MYSITIGDAKLVKSEFGNELVIHVNRLNSDDAPVFEDSGWLGSSCGPSYSVMHDFVNRTKTKKIFAKDPEHESDPVTVGIFSLSEKDVYQIKKRRKKWQKKYPDAVPRYNHNKSVEDACLARLLMYEFWITYAVENCETPAIGIFG